MKKGNSVAKQGAKGSHATNSREIMRQMLSMQLKGNRATEIALGEVVNNSLDAGASKVRIMFFTHNKKIALFVMDNGRGFTLKGADSILSYMFSEKGRFDKRTAGVNGSGSKAVLGLGDLDKTKVDVISFSEDFPNGMELEYDFEYLVALNDKKVSQGVLRRTSSYKAFSSIWERKTGTNFILTGFDGRKLNLKSLIAALENCLTPRNSNFVKVVDDEKELIITPKEVDGEPFNFSDDSSKSLGETTFDLRYSGRNDGPKICGKYNYICDFAEVYSSLSGEQKKKITRIWNSIGGYIYIENINMYRQHNGTFDKDFYSSKACSDLVELFELVAAELGKLSEKEKDEKEMTEQRNLVKQIAEASMQLNPHSFQKGFGNKKVVGPNSDQEIFIVPKNIVFEAGETVAVTLSNKGTKIIDLTKAKWLTSPLVTIQGSGQKVTITAGKKLGKGELIISGNDWSHKITIKIKEPLNKPIIVGPQHVTPGSTGEYTIKRFSQKVTWVLGADKKDVEVVGENGGSISVFVKPETKIESFVLKCLNDKNSIIATRRIQVSDQIRNTAPVVTIGGKQYILRIATDYPNVVAQVEDDDEDDSQSIIINPLHEATRRESWYIKMRELTTAICMAAMLDQVKNDGLSAEKGNSLAWKSIMELRTIIAKNKKGDN